MPYWLFDLLVLVLPAALLLRGARSRVSGGGLRRTAGAVAVLSAVAVLWTGPWDEHLVRTGVWGYGPDRVLATVRGVPVEEYAFVVLLVVLVAAWGLRTGLLPAPLVPRPDRGCGSARRAGAVGWLVVGTLGGLLLLPGGPLRYLGLLLVWLAPPMLLQRAVAGDLLRAARARRAALALPVALWLCVADRLALADGIWAISPASSTGLAIAGLPVEEAAFFVLVTVLVADALLLACSDVALARARALVGPVRRRVASRS